MRKLLALGLVLALAACLPMKANADPPKTERASLQIIKRESPAFTIPAPTLAAEEAVFVEYAASDSVAVLTPQGVHMQLKGSAARSGNAITRAARTVSM